MFDRILFLLCLLVRGVFVGLECFCCDFLFYLFLVFSCFHCVLLFLACLWCWAVFVVGGRLFLQRLVGLRLFLLVWVVLLCFRRLVFLLVVVCLLVLVCSGFGCYSYLFVVVGGGGGGVGCCCSVFCVV